MCVNECGQSTKDGKQILLAKVLDITGCTGKGRKSKVKIDKVRGWSGAEKIKGK